MRKATWTNTTQPLTDRIVDRSIESAHFSLPCKLRTRALERRTFDLKTRHARAIMRVLNITRNDPSTDVPFDWNRGMNFPFEKRAHSPNPVPRLAVSRLHTYHRIRLPCEKVLLGLLPSVAASPSTTHGHCCIHPTQHNLPVSIPPTSLGRSDHEPGPFVDRRKTEWTVGLFLWRTLGRRRRIRGVSSSDPRRTT